MTDSDISKVVGRVDLFIQRIRRVRRKEFSQERVQCWLDGLQYMDSMQSHQDIRTYAVRDLIRTIGGLDGLTTDLGVYPGERLRIRDALVDRYDLPAVRPPWDTR